MATPCAVLILATWKAKKNLGALIAKSPPSLRMPASVAWYRSRLVWKAARSVDASGSAVANLSSANWRGDEDLEKSISEKETPLDVTSGTLPIVVEVPQVTLLAMALALSAVSFGSVVDPTRKQAS